LRYIEGVINEVFRLRPAAPLAIPHVAERECIIGGYTIAKGSVVVQNIYGIGNMEKYFTNPAEFDPERWINNNSELSSKLLLFGSGLTVCLGMPIAKQEMFLSVASMIQKYKFRFDPSSSIPDILGVFKLEFRPAEWHTIASLR